MEVALHVGPLGLLYHYQFSPYQMVIVCEMPQCINNQNMPDMAQQVPHGKHAEPYHSGECRL